MQSNLHLLSSTKVIEEIKAGNTSAVKWMESCADQIEKREHEIKAWVYFEKELAIKQAQIIDNKIKNGIDPGPFFGAPIAVKDIFNTIDMPASMGSPIWEGFTPGNDARVVSKLRESGAVIAGKTVTAEFAVHYPGPTVNPHNPAHTPGTSSSGSAAAVASFMVPLALGTQTAGSTIRPASYCGIYGFKPSFGIIPRTGLLKTLDTLDHVTFMARAIEDIALLLNNLRVKGSNYPFVHKNMDNNKHDEKKKLWKIAVVRTPAWDQAEKYAQEALIKFAEDISKIPQIVIEETELSEKFGSVHDLHEMIYTKALSYYFKEEYENHGDLISKQFSEMVETGNKIAHREYIQGFEQQNYLAHQLDKFFDNYDIILSLSTAGEAPKGLHAIEKKDPCLIWTLCRAPAINVPVFKGPKGLPFGAQFVAKRFNDDLLLDFLRVLKDNGCMPD